MCSRRYPQRTGRPSIRFRIRRPAPNQKEGSDMASREQELSALPQTSDPPRGRLSVLLRRLIYPVLHDQPRGLVPEVMGRVIYPFLHGEAPKPQTPTGFYTDTTVCIGCKACEGACKQWNQLPSDGFNFSGNSYDNTNELSATTWRHVKFIEQFSIESLSQLAFMG